MLSLKILDRFQRPCFHKKLSIPLDPDTLVAWVDCVLKKSMKQTCAVEITGIPDGAKQRSWYLFVDADIQCLALIFIQACLEILDASCRVTDDTNDKSTNAIENGIIPCLDVFQESKHIGRRWA
jgi:hypothetical protein